MKKLFLILLSLSFFTYTACKKRDTDNISKVVEVSHPDIKLNGEKFISLRIGESYDDPGAVATDDITGAKSNIEPDYSNLDPSQPGLYYTLFSAKNSNGYISYSVRYFAVTEYDDAADLSGTYARTANGVEVNVTKVARALYRNDDMGGAGINDNIYFAVINDSTISVGPQFSESLGTEIGTANEMLSLEEPYQFQYSLDAPGYGTAVRVFVKQ